MDSNQMTDEDDRQEWFVPDGEESG